MQHIQASIDPASSPEPVASRGPATELAELRIAYSRLLDRQRCIMELIGSKDADRILHDLRNILNERELLRAVANL